MRLYYDLHIHSALSPCGDEDMTPNNIVNMAYLQGLDIIALTDHNSALNVRAAMKVAEGKIRVIPGIEVTTAEEVHTLCYFPDADSAEDMGEFLKKNMQGIKNRPEIFGRQLIMDCNDEIVGEEDELLVSGVNLDIYQVAEATRERGGIFVPAHINKPSYSITSNLGFMPPDLEYDALEISKSGLEEYSKMYPNSFIFTSSDAHYLENISEKTFFVEKTDNMTEKLYNFLCSF